MSNQIQNPNVKKVFQNDQLFEGWSLLYSICYVFYMRYRSSVHKIEKEQKLVDEYRKQKKGLDVSFPLHPHRFQREQAFENIKHRLHSDLSQSEQALSPLRFEEADIWQTFRSCVFVFFHGHYKSAGNVFIVLSELALVSKFSVVVA